VSALFWIVQTTLVVLKLTGTVAWPWVSILAPALGMVALYALIGLAFLKAYGDR
jgi:hypothetical protein